jgi:hypothetical protein
VNRQFDRVRDAIYGPYLAAVEAERSRILQSCGVEGSGSVRKELAIGPHVMRFNPQAPKGGSI